MSLQLSFLDSSHTENFVPKQPTPGKATWDFDAYLRESELAEHSCAYEDWVIQESSSELSYLTHGFLRYFGKFPPPVAKRFIGELHDPQQGPIFDPMAGSGTSLVEAALSGRAAVGLDASPLACLASRVKTTPLASCFLQEALERYQTFMCQGEEPPTNCFPADTNLDHWFWPQTQRELARTRQFIDQEENEMVRDALRLALAAVVRRLSRASNGLGRMFLDPAIEPGDTVATFSKKVREFMPALAALQQLKPHISVEQHDARHSFEHLPVRIRTNLAICHPPYFNVYRYSSIYKYELLWAGFDYKDTHGREVRDGFKIGKPELVHLYVEDMTVVLANIARALVPGGWCVLMIGDTFLRGQRINTTAKVIERAMRSDIGFEVSRVIVRHPKYTEASYAATQRRNGKEIGVKLPDHIVVLRKGEGILSEASS